jgi:hypothetical protein
MAAWILQKLDQVVGVGLVSTRQQLLARFHQSQMTLKDFADITASACPHSASGCIKSALPTTLNYVRTRASWCDVVLSPLIGSGHGDSFKPDRDV